MSKSASSILPWFGHRIKSLRIQRNLSQEQLAQLAGIDRTYVGGVERGERNVSLLNIRKLANALGVELRDLFDDAFKL